MTVSVELNGILVRAAPITPKSSNVTFTLSKAEMRKFESSTFGKEATATVNFLSNASVIAFGGTRVTLK